MDDPESEQMDSSPSQLPSKLPPQPPRKCPACVPSARKNKGNKGKARDDTVVAPMDLPASIPTTSKQKRRHDPTPDPPVAETPLTTTTPAPAPPAKVARSSKVPTAIPVVEISPTSPPHRHKGSPPRKMRKFVPSAVGQVRDSKHMSCGTAALILLAGALRSLH